MIDDTSGVMFLDRTDHIDASHYENQHGTEYWGASSRADALAQTHDDDARRVRYIADLKPKSYLDFGCGAGGTMELLKGKASFIAGLEVQEDIAAILSQSVFTMYENENALPGNTFDVVSLFHVLEHLIEPMESLRALRKSMKLGGTLLVEIPHAHDILLTTFDLEAFKKFTFWSEHLILHTKTSLRAFLEAAEFRDISVEGIQRYPLSNHLYWLAKGEPGGQNKLAELNDPKLNAAYESTLKKLDRTDTLLAKATK